MNDFQSFGLAAPILKALTQEGYERPTPIQIQAIPHVMLGADLQGIAQTGTGKTAAFALPILHRLAAAPGRAMPRSTRVLVLSPTRELASQINESFRTYGRNLRLVSTVVFGGVPIGRQQRALAGGVDILVATPGRLLDLIDQRSLTLQGVEILVLDEADQMLDLGFIHALRRIVTLVPKKRQTLFFSATMPKSIEQLSAQFITDPVKVAVTPVATTAERVDQSVMFCAQNDKPALLKAVLKDETIDRVLVFTRTKHGADKVVRQLEMGGVSAAAIHGNKSQGQRERALADFKGGRNRVLVATDIAARGIDVEGVSHVVNFDLPNVPESYVHRIGRTARAGAAGQAISFCNREEREYLRDIEKLTRLKVTVQELPPNFMANATPEPVEERSERQPQRGRPQGRGGNGDGRREGRPWQPALRDAAAPRQRGERREHGAAQGRPAQPSQGRGTHSAQPARPGQAPARPGRSAGQQDRGPRQDGGQRRDGGGQRREGGGQQREGNDIAWLQRGPRPQR